MSILARVFLDTSAVKHSIRSRTVLHPHTQTITFNGKTHEVMVHDIVEIDPASGVNAEPLRTEINLLSDVAKFAKAGDIELLSHIEMEMEFIEIQLFGRSRSEFDDIPIQMVDGPVRYDRVLAPSSPFSPETSKSLQIDFLKSLNHSRYRELQRACGAHQGSKINENQLIDAFHIWCAESGGASHFLTTDLKLTRLVRQHRTAPPHVRVVTPSELLEELAALKKPASTEENVAS